MSQDKKIERFTEKSVEAFKLLVKDLKSYRAQAVAQHPGKDDKARQKQKKMIQEDILNVTSMKRFLNSYVGTLSIQDGVESKRKSMARLVSSYLVGEVSLPEALSKVQSWAPSAYKRTQTHKGQRALKEALPPEIRAFLPDSIQIEVDEDGHIKEISDKFGNETYHLAEKIKTQKNLIKRYNSIVKKVREDLTSENERTRLSALITSIIMETGIRPGQAGNKIVKVDEEGNNLEIETFGAVTLGPSHIRFFKDNFARIKFKGKKGTENVAEVTDSQILGMLKDYTETARKEGSDYIFIEESGRQYCYEDLRRYFQKNFKGFKITDFRKLRATQEVFDALKEERRDLMKRIKGFADLEMEELYDKVVKEIVVTLEKVHERAQVALSHDSSNTTKTSYINPEIILRFISSAQLGQNLRQCILSGKTKLSFDPMVFIREAQKTASTLHTSGSINSPLNLSQLQELLEGVFLLG